MANFTWDSRSLNNGDPHTSSGANRKGGAIELSDLNSYIEIPQYSTIDSATLTVYFKETTNRTGNADLYVDLTDSATLGSSTKQLYYGNGVVPKNDPANHASRSIDLIEKECITTSGVNVGNISYENARYLIISFQSAFLSRTYSYYFVLSIDYTEHTCSWNSGAVTKAATCTATGTKTYTCTVCGATKTETISALGHSFGTTTAAKSATCLAAGNSAYKKCSRCNLYFAGSAATNATGGKSDTSSFTIAKKSHSYTGAIKSDGNGKDATHSFKCVNGCNQYGGAVKHTWNSGSVTKQPTCTESGVRTYTCTASGCGATYTETISAKGHTEVTIPAVEPTCTATGLTAGKKCSVCGAIITAQQTVPAKGHSYTDVVTQPTETANGYTTHTCKNDSSHSYVDTYTCLATFKNYDGSVLKTEKVNQGGTPTAPTNPTRKGYKFIGWSPAVGAINNSTVFTAVYEKLPPQITTVTITRSSDLANVSISAPVDAGAKFIISVEVT